MRNLAMFAVSYEVAQEFKGWIGSRFVTGFTTLRGIDARRGNG